MTQVQFYINICILLLYNNNNKTKKKKKETIKTSTQHSIFTFTFLLSGGYFKENLRKNIWINLLNY